MRPRHTNDKPNWIINRFKRVEKQIRELSAARRLEAATIGKGGITIKGGGKIIVPYPDDLGTGDAVYVGPETIDGYDFFTLRVAPWDGGTSILAVQSLPPQLDLPDGSTQAAMKAGIVSLEADETLVAWLPATQEGLTVSPGETFLTSDGEVVLDGGSGGVRIVHSTTGSAANCFIDPSNNRIWRSTSSLRYKQDVEDVEVDPATVLKMQGRTWRDKLEVEKDPETVTRHVGFLAEELHDLGLGQFVVYDADGEPEAISYDRLSVALLAVVKDQERRIAALESADERATDA